MLPIKDALVQLNVEEAKILQVSANCPTSVVLTLHTHKQIQIANVCCEAVVGRRRLVVARLAAGTIFVNYQRYVKVILEEKEIRKEEAHKHTKLCQNKHAINQRRKVACA